MAQLSIVQLAKQGDPRAIAFLVTQTLHKYGITARASRKGRCLKLLLEAEQVPHPATMSRIIDQGMQKLQPLSVEVVKLYGRKKGQKDPAWRQVIELTASVNSPTEAEFDPASNGAEMSIFRLDDLDPDAMILLPVKPQVQLTDISPDAMILLPVEPGSVNPAIAEEFTATEDMSDLTVDSTDSTFDASFDQATGQAILADAAAVPQLRSSQFDPAAPFLAIKLPKRLTRILLGFLWLQAIIWTLTLIYSLLGASSFSLYTGLDLVNTNLPFASLLSAVVGIAGLLFAPLDRLGLWITIAALLLSLLWLYHLHASLKPLLGAYPISPTGAVMRFVLPLYNLWGIGNVCFTLAKRLSSDTTLVYCRVIRRLTNWLYFLLLLAIGLQGFYIWAISIAPINAISDAASSLWFYVIRDGVVWLLSLVWLRLVRNIWRAVRRIYQERVAAFLPAAGSKPRIRSRRVSVKAILLGGGAILLSLVLFNCVLGLIASVVFVSNGLRSEAILPTFLGSESLLILVLVGSFFCIGLGGFLTAALAPASSMLHVLGLGVLLTLIGLALQRLPQMADLPFWFQTASAVLIIPAILLGGGLRQWLKTL
jgi:hypothetical protein